MRVFAVTYGGGHVPIAMAMCEPYRRAGIKYDILAMPAAIEPLRRAGLPFKTLAGYANLFENWPEITALGEHLAREHHNPKSGIGYEDTVVYFGLSMFDLIREKGADVAWRLFNKLERKAFMPVWVMEKILNSERPDFVQVTCSVRMELAAVRAAKKCGLTSFRIQNTPYLVKKSEPDFLFLINDDQKRRYLAAGQAPEKLFVTGHPCFERYGQMDKAAERKRLAPLLRRANGPVVAWFPAPPSDDLIPVYQELMRIAARRPEWNVVIKLHPTRHDDDCLAPHWPHLPSNVLIVKDYEASSLIRAADVVLVDCSTVGFEALLMGLPLVVIYFFDYIEYYDISYGEREAALLVEHLAELETALSEALYNDDIRRRLSEACRSYKSSANASANIVAALIDIASGGVPGGFYGGERRSLLRV